jgi:hypothetical protein
VPSNRLAALDNVRAGLCVRCADGGPDETDYCNHRYSGFERSHSGCRSNTNIAANDRRGNLEAVMAEAGAIRKTEHT